MLLLHIHPIQAMPVFQALVQILLIHRLLALWQLRPRRLLALENTHHVRGLGQMRVHTAHEWVDQVRERRIVQPQHAAALAAEVPLGGEALGPVGDGGLQRGVLAHGAVAGEDLQGRGHAADVDAAGGAADLAANCAEAELVGHWGVRLEGVGYCAAVAGPVDGPGKGEDRVRFLGWKRRGDGGMGYIGMLAVTLQVG